MQPLQPSDRGSATGACFLHLTIEMACDGGRDKASRWHLEVSKGDTSGLGVVKLIGDGEGRDKGRGHQWRHCLAHRNAGMGVSELMGKARPAGSRCYRLPAVHAAGAAHLV